MATAKKAPKQPYHEKVAEKMIEQLRQGTAPWQKQWDDTGWNSHLPSNPITGKAYRGINTLVLMSEGRDDNRWLTYKQAASIDAQVRKGEKGTTIEYWKFNDTKDKKDENGKPVLDANGKPVKVTIKLDRPRAFYATVFNAEQIDNMPPLEQKPREWEPLEEAEKIIANCGVEVSHGGHKAYYSLGTDSIRMPDRASFDSAEKYTSVLLHEIGHSTGHHTRLDRDLSHPFGSEGYAREELRAEISSLMVGGQLGIANDPSNHTAYVASWIKVLEDDPREIFRAAADASKITDMVMSYTQEQEQTIDNTQTLDTQGQDMKPDQNEQTVAAMEAAINQERQFLAVPFAEKDEAKKLGAKWDKEAKSWYVGAGANPEDLSKWVLSANPVQEAAVSPVDATQDIYNISAADAKQIHKDAADAIAEMGAPADAAQDIYNISAADAKQIHKDAADAIAEMGAPADAAQDIYNISAADAKQIYKDAADAIAEIDARKNARKNARQFLAVPFAEKDEAKKLGAKWDKEAKSWYVGAGANPEDLSKWVLSANPVQEAALSPVDEFKDVLLSMGCVVDGNHPVMDGTRQRIKLIDDKAGQTSGFYVAHLDGRPAGFVMNNRTQEEIKWKSKGYSLTDSQKAELAAVAATKRAQRDKERTETHEAKAKVATYLINDKFVPANETPYLAAKGIQAVKGVYTDEEAKKTFIPAHDLQGKIWTMQTVEPDGQKRFLKDARKEGTMHFIGGVDAMQTPKVIVIAEGYATAASIASETDHTCVAAFDSGNLKQVASELRAQYPDTPIIIAGDADPVHKDLGYSVGMQKAIEAASAVNGAALFPSFSKELTEGDNAKSHVDFNDLARVAPKGSIARQVENPVALEIIKMERLTLERKQQHTKESSLER